MDVAFGYTRKHVKAISFPDNFNYFWTRDSYIYAYSSLSPQLESSLVFNLRKSCFSFSKIIFKKGRKFEKTFQRKWITKSWAFLIKIRVASISHYFCGRSFEKRFHCRASCHIFDFRCIKSSHYVRSWCISTVELSKLKMKQSIEAKIQ